MTNGRFFWNSAFLVLPVLQSLSWIEGVFVIQEVSMGSCVLCRFSWEGHLQVNGWKETYILRSYGKISFEVCLLYTTDNLAFLTHPTSRGQGHFPFEKVSNEERNGVGECVSCLLCPDNIGMDGPPLLPPLSRL
jgi:hypothetical protein